MLIKNIDHILENLKQRLTNFPWIYVLFSIGAFLRISGFTVRKLWYDEIFSLEMTRQNLFEMISALRINITPPGWETFLWFFTHVFGWDAFGLRVSSVIASIVTLWIVHRIGITLQFSKGQLIASMAIVSLLPYQLIYAQTGRVYALFTMIYLLGLYAALTKRWLVLGICSAALFWCHNVSFMFVPGLFVIALFVHPKNWKRIALILFLSVLVYIPWIGISLKRAVTPVGWFAPLALDTFIVDFIFALFGYYLPSRGMATVFLGLLTLCIMAVIPPLARWIYRDMRKDIAALQANTKDIRKWVSRFAANNIVAENSLTKRRSKCILILAFAIPLSLLTLASIFVQNVLFARTIFLLTIPFVMWLVAIYVVPIPNMIHKTIWGVTVLILVTGVISWSPTQLGGDFTNLEYIFGRDVRYGGVFTPLSNNQNSNEPGDVIFHNTGFSALLFEYYFPDNPNYLIDGNDVAGLGDVQLTKTPIRQIDPEEISAQRLWVVYSPDMLMAKVNSVADERTRQLILKYNCPFVSYLHYPQSSDFAVYLCDLHQK